MAQVNKNMIRKGLPEAVSYCLDHWLPVHTDHLASVLLKAENGAYEADKEALINDVKADLGLLFHCLKRLAQFNASPRPIENPILFLEGLNQGQLIQLFSIAPESISQFKFEALTKIHASRLRQSLISSTTVQLIAQKTGVDPNLAFSLAAMRQLGQSLMAWNYKATYARAITTEAEGNSDANEYLKTIFGFHPDELGRGIIQKLKFSPDIVRLMEKTELSGKENESYSSRTNVIVHNPTLSRIADYCLVGEAFARVNEVDIYPKSHSDLGQIFRSLDGYLGSNSIKLIKEKLLQSAAIYENLELGELIFPELETNHDYQFVTGLVAANLEKQNPYAAQCKEEIQLGLDRVYKLVRQNMVSVEAITVLVTEVLPAMGFNKGCLFLLDKKTMMLIPRLRIGNCSLSDYKPISCANSLEDVHPISGAYFSDSPVRHQAENRINPKQTKLSWHLGKNQRAGVIVLEIQEGSPAAGKTNEDSVTVFKAVQNCANDCLNLH